MCHVDAGESFCFETHKKESTIYQEATVAINYTLNYDKITVCFKAIGGNGNA